MRRRACCCSAPSLSALSGSGRWGQDSKERKEGRAVKNAVSRVSSFAVWGGVKFCDTLPEASSSRPSLTCPVLFYLSCRGWQRKRKGRCTRQREGLCTRQRESLCTRQHASSVPYIQTHVRVRERRPVLKFGECAGTKTEGLTQLLAARQ